MESWDLSSSLNSSANDVRPPSSISSSRIGSSVVRTTKSAFTEDTLMEYIPDLDEVQEEDLTMAVAAAPEYKIQQITSLKELDADLLQSKPFSTVDGVSLRKLSKFMVPERFLIENDEFWDWENTYTEIASEFRKSYATVQPKKTDIPVLDMSEGDNVKK